MRTTGVLGIIGCAASLLWAANVGDPAPSFVLPDGHHHNHSLKDFKETVVFVNFWASWCAPCQSELPALNQLALDYKDKRVRVMAIDVDRDHGDAQKLLSHLGLEKAALQILYDPQGRAPKAYDIDSMPASFVIDQRHIVRYKHLGFHTADIKHWHDEIDQLLSSK